MELYPELQDSVKELTVRDARLLGNELDTTLLQNESSIIKRELEQKERDIEELMQEISSSSNENEGEEGILIQQIKQKVNKKLDNLR
jgi:hypothetical protein